jgi:GNAT superfamily N-acetyltransferase
VVAIRTIPAVTREGAEPALSFDEVDPAMPDATTAMARYFGELDERFPSGFDPGAPGAGGDTSMRRPAGVFVVVRAEDGSVAGCGGVVHLDEATSEIKRMWIDPGWRGRGVARRLLAHLEGLVAADGRRRVLLDTNGTLVEAIALYGRAGYRSIERYNDNPYAEHWFAKDLP